MDIRRIVDKLSNERDINIYLERQSLGNYFESLHIVRVHLFPSLSLSVCLSESCCAEITPRIQNRFQISQRHSSLSQNCDCTKLHFRRSEMTMPTR